jgi:glycine/D-amino acid oxidase-like deaminating enzyme
MTGWDTVIVGAGIAGLSLAEALTRTPGSRVLILEAARVGAGASTRNAGRLTHAHCTTYARAALAYEARLAVLDLQMRLGSSFAIQTLGELTIFYREDEAVRAVKETLPALREVGLRGQLLDPHQLRLTITGFDPQGVVAALAVDASFALHHDAVIYALKRTLERRGVTIRTGAVVSALISSGDTVSGVMVGNQLYEAATIAICCAEGALDLLAQLGCYVPLKVVRQQALILASVQDQHWPIIRWLGPHASGSIHRVARGELLAASQRPGGDLQRDHNCTADFLTRTARELGQKLPALRGAAIIRQWGGLTTMTADDLPYAGKVPGQHGLWALFGMNAFTMYPLFAAHLAQAIRGDVPTSLLRRSALSQERGIRALP